MYKFLCIVILGLFINCAFADPVPPRLMRNIKGHHVMKATLQKGVFRLTTSYEEVPYAAYEKIILTGVCKTLLLDPNKGWGKAWIDRIEYLNRKEEQGYTLVEARNTCLAIGNIQEDHLLAEYILKKTGTCLDNMCQLPD